VDDPGLLLISVFLVLLPLVNAALDWLSLGFTYGLLHAIGRRSGAWWPCSSPAYCILLALVFLFLIASLTTLLLSLLNLATVACGGGQPLLDLQLLFDGLARESGALEFAWIHFMMLPTLIPTLLHFSVAGFAAVLILPQGWRRWILQDWKKSNHARAVLNR